ncbi:MAG: hypothetical protein ACTSU2_00140, partial [Promethearchaeota archaeon]
DDDDNWHAIEEFFDVDGLLKFTNETWDMIQKREIPTVSNIFKINKSTIPKTFRQLLDFTDNLSDYAYRQAMKAYYIAGAARYFKGDINFVFKNKNLFFSFIKLMFNASLQSADQFWKAKNLMISSMHFQDPYNFDIERVQRCLVHYGVIDPDDPTKVREIPFCSMNTIHRADIEKRLAKRKETRTIAQIDKEVSELIESFAKEE